MSDKKEHSSCLHLSLITHHLSLPSLSMRVVPDVSVTTRAGDFAHLRVRAFDGLHYGFMTGAAGALRYFVVVLGYLYRLVKAADREVERVPEAVARLRVVFAQSVVRRVT